MRMNGSASHLNTFTDGMWSDFDAQQVSNKTYIDAFNGRVIYNADGTLSFENMKGTLLALTLGFDYNKATDYKIMGWAYIDNRLILLSTQNSVTFAGGNSEIGFITEQQFGVYAYQTAFNDKYDPNNQLMRLSTRYQAKSNGVFENRDIVRIYWNDDKNDPRVFNIVAGLTRVNPEFVDGDYNPLNATGKYPTFYSVHGMDRMCDVQYGLLKYVKNVSGNLTVGERYYTYRLVHKSGYATPWAPLAAPVLLTSDQVNQFDWNQYRMQASGDPTNKGHQIEVKYIDQRFQFLEVACALYETDLGAIRADIVFKGEITGTSMIVNHIDNTGIQPILPEQLVQRYTDSKHEKTQTVNENHYHVANIFLRPNLEIDTTDITVEPLLKRMLSDELKGVDLAPLTHQVPKTTTITKNLFSGVSEQYVVDNDYINYKGTQWRNLFEGQWREGIYPYSIVVFNRKGQPCFAQHIGDFTQPAQYSNQWTLKKLSGTTTGTTGAVGDYSLTNYDPGSTYQITDTIQQGDNFVLNILGTTFSGIDLTDILYDENGQLQVSGFSIVRTERVPDIICQGLPMNCTIFEPYQNQAPTVYPHHSSGNRYDLPGAGAFTFASSSVIDHGTMLDGSILSGVVKGGIITFEAPDLCINPALITPDISYNLKVVGNCQAAFLPTNVHGSEPLQLNGGHGHFYTKQYTTYMGGVTWFNCTLTGGGSYVGIQPFADWGMEEQVSEVVPNVFRETSFGIGDGYYKINNGEVYLDQFYPPLSSTDINFYASGHEFSAYMNTLNGDNRFINFSSWATPWNNMDNSNNICYFIANYRTGLPNYDITPSLLANRVYKNIGHFVPINATTIAAATQGSGRVVFNGVEVWGGDCYVDYFSYTRLYPLYQGKTDPTLDYAFGLITPIESNYNHTLRTNNFYSKDGTRPEATELLSNINSNSMWQNGMFISGIDSTYFRLENFDINKCLQSTDTISSYNVKNIYFREEDDQPLLEMVSEVKFNGEFLDSYRYFLVNNNQVADGKLGYITDIEPIGINLYVLQEKGFGRIRYNERTMLTTDAANLTVGSGTGYQGHEYIDFEAGCQHQFGVVNTGRNIYWPNAYKGKYHRFGQDGLNKVSDLRGQHNFFFNHLKDFWQIPDVLLQDGNENIYDNPCDVGGIATVFDFNNESVYLTFTQRKQIIQRVLVEVGVPDSIEYSEATNQFKCRPAFTPRIYFNLKQNVLSPDPDNQNMVYVHNQGMKGHVYGQFRNTTIKFSVNPDIEIDKVMDNAKFNMNPDGYKLAKQVVLTNENQAQLVIFNDPLDPRPVYRDKYLVYPTMQENQGVRMRGKYMLLEYTFDNGANAGQDTLLRITSHETFFRKSYR